jgi:ketosteroid isomerase-like protein
VRVSEESLEFVRRFIGLFAGQDLVAVNNDTEAVAAMVEQLDPEVEIRWTGTIPDVETYRGHDGAVRAMEDWLESWEEFRMYPREFIDIGDDRVVVTFGQTGRGKGSGAEVEMPVTQIYTVRDGRLAGILEFATKAEAMEAAGLPTP